MKKATRENFYNDGFGWKCKTCERELREDRLDKVEARLLKEGEAESKIPELSTPALARWADDEKDTLICPRCGQKEKIS